MPLRPTWAIALLAIVALIVAPTAADAAAVRRPGIRVPPGGIPTGTPGGTSSNAATATSSPTGPAPGSKASTPPTATRGYDLDFTLPTAGKSGCMVCHGDKNLIRQKAGKLVSYYVDPAMLEGSAHARTNCTGCHLDFAYRAPHTGTGDWRRTAKLSCKNCHQQEFQAFGLGVHSISLAPGAKPDPKAASKPLCGDCHGAHDMAVLTDDRKTPDVDEGKAGRRQLRAQGWKVCGRCHEDYWGGWNDYYHGAAYRSGASDAPPCWDCHGAHDIYKSTDRRSIASPARLPDTCGTCHPTANDAYTSYAGLVHRRQSVLDSNPLYSLVQRAKRMIGGLAESVTSLFT